MIARLLGTGGGDSMRWMSSCPPCIHSKVQRPCSGCAESPGSMASTDQVPTNRWRLSMPQPEAIRAPLRDQFCTSPGKLAAGRRVVGRSWRGGTDDIDGTDTGDTVGGG